jgi:ParB family chromosome partitioning protein
MSHCRSRRGGEAEREAAAVCAEGWKWIEVAPDFAYGHAFGLRQLLGVSAAPRKRKDARRASDRIDRLTNTRTLIELPETVDERL